MPKSRDSIGISDVPNGKEWYEYLARYHTTTDLTPDEIHEIGLREVAKIRAEMEGIIDRVGWEGDFNSFLQYLRTDPKFYYETGEELLQAYRAMSKEIDAYMPTLFNKLPRAPYGVIPIPMESAPFTTTAYYNAPSAGRPGYYYANLYMPEVRPNFWHIKIGVIISWSTCTWSIVIRCSCERCRLHWDWNNAIRCSW